MSKLNVHSNDSKPREMNHVHFDGQSFSGYSCFFADSPFFPSGVATEIMNLELEKLSH